MVKQNRLDPKALELGVLDDMRQILYDMRDMERDLDSKGIVEPFETVTVTDERRTIIARGGKWQSLTIINDGPDSVWVLVNPGLSNDPHRINDGEVHTVDFHRPRIGEVVLWCEDGHRTSLRVVGLK